MRRNEEHAAEGSFGLVGEVGARVRAVERDGAELRVPHVQRRVVAEADERDRILALPLEVEAVQDAHGPVAAAQRPDRVVRQVVERRLQIREPLRVGPGQEAVARGGARVDDRVEPEAQAAADGRLDALGRDRPRGRDQRDAGPGPERARLVALHASPRDGGRGELNATGRSAARSRS
jgi:hypothetical protein